MENEPGPAYTAIPQEKLDVVWMLKTIELRFRCPYRTTKKLINNEMEGF